MCWRLLHCTRYNGVPVPILTPPCAKPNRPGLISTDVVLSFTTEKRIPCYFRLAFFLVTKPIFPGLIYLPNNRLKTIVTPTYLVCPGLFTGRVKSRGSVGSCRVVSGRVESGRVGSGRAMVTEADP